MLDREVACPRQPAVGCTGEEQDRDVLMVGHPPLNDVDAGIARVVIVDGGFMGENGVGYLGDHGVEIQRTEGPKDPRATS